MSTIAVDRNVRNNRFQVIVQPFLRDEGLAFADVLSGQAIEQAFAQEGGLFGQKDIFSTQIVLWAFLAQTLRDGKGAACAQAVTDIATYMLQMGLAAPCGDTGDYCRARAKLSPKALRRLVAQAAGELECGADPSWLWHGLHAKLVDGFTFTMMDTCENQRRFPQPGSQAAGVGFPMGRACAVLSLATAAIHDLAVGPYQGKQTGETALLRDMLDAFHEGDVAVFDRYFCSYMMLATLQGRGVDVCTRRHQCRRSDFRRGKRLGDFDHLVSWVRPKRPDWMSPELYARTPQTLTLRELQFVVTEPGRRPSTITVITTLTDPLAYPKDDIAALYNYRWNAELDIRAIKDTLNLGHVLCKSPAMVDLRLWVTLLAYNLIRNLIATAAVVESKTTAAAERAMAAAAEDNTAAVISQTANTVQAATPGAAEGKQPRQLGFTLACQTVLSSWMLLSTGACADPKKLWESALKRIAANVVANRPGRVEPRVLKRRRHRYPLMTRPRHELREELSMT